MFFALTAQISKLHQKFWSNPHGDQHSANRKNFTSGLFFEDQGKLRELDRLPRRTRPMSDEFVYHAIIRGNNRGPVFLVANELEK